MLFFFIVMASTIFSVMTLTVYRQMLPLEKLQLVLLEIRYTIRRHPRGMIFQQLQVLHQPRRYTHQQDPESCVSHQCQATSHLNV